MNMAAQDRNTDPLIAAITATRKDICILGILALLTSSGSEQKLIFTAACGDSTLSRGLTGSDGVQPTFLEALFVAASSEGICMAVDVEAGEACLPFKDCAGLCPSQISGIPAL